MRSAGLVRAVPVRPRPGEHRARDLAGEAIPAPARRPVRRELDVRERLEAVPRAPVGADVSARAVGTDRVHPRRRWLGVAGAIAARPRHSAAADQSVLDRRSEYLRLGRCDRRQAGLSVLERAAAGPGDARETRLPGQGIADRADLDDRLREPDSRRPGGVRWLLLHVLRRGPDPAGPVPAVGRCRAADPQVRQAAPGRERHTGDRPRRHDLHRLDRGHRRTERRRLLVRRGAPPRPVAQVGDVAARPGQRRLRRGSHRLAGGRRVLQRDVLRDRRRSDDQHAAGAQRR